MSEPLVNQIRPRKFNRGEKNEDLIAFSQPDGKQCLEKRIPQPRRGNDRPKKSYMFRIECEPCPRAMHGNALSRDAQVATVERRHEEKRAEHWKKLSRKRQADKHSRLIDQRLNEPRRRWENSIQGNLSDFSIFGTATLDDVEELQETFDLLQNKNADIVHSLSDQLTYVKKLDNMNRINRNTPIYLILLGIRLFSHTTDSNKLLETLCGWMLLFTIRVKYTWRLGN